MNVDIAWVDGKTIRNLKVESVVQNGHYARIVFSDADTKEALCMSIGGDSNDCFDAAQALYAFGVAVKQSYMSYIPPCFGKNMREDNNYVCKKCDFRSECVKN